MATAENVSLVSVNAVNATGVGSTRCRAGFKFGPDPIEVEVTDEQLALLEADKVLNVKMVKDKKTLSAEKAAADKKAAAAKKKEAK